MPACREVARPRAQRGFATVASRAGNSRRIAARWAPSTIATASQPPRRSVAACRAASGMPSAPRSNALGRPMRRDAPPASTMPTVFIVARD